MNKYTISARLDIGNDREELEDFVQYVELGDTEMFCVMADGTGSRENYPHPAGIAVMEICAAVQEYFKAVPEHFLSSPCEFMTFAMERSNRVLAAFKAGNEELFSGYAASVTCCLLTRDRGIHIAHSGNTRAYVIRDGNARQLTQDMTKASELLRDGKITAETYYVHPDRLVLTGGIGISGDLNVQTLSGHIRGNDIVLLTTDGIHYAIKPEHFGPIILNERTPDEAAEALVLAARDGIKYPDNMAALVAFDQTAGADAVGQ